MQMRERPLRGKKYRLITTGDEITALETITHNMVRILLPNGKLTAVLKKELELPIIETKDYERLGD